MSNVDFRVKKGLIVAENATISGNVSANKFIGDGSELTNIDSNQASILMYEYSK